MTHFPTPRYSLQRNEKVGSHKNLSANVYGDFIDNCQNMETTQMPLNWRMDKPYRVEYYLAV